MGVGEAGGTGGTEGEADAFGGREGLVHRFAAAWVRWPSGRSGAGWGRSQGLPWVGGGLGGALRRQGR